MSDLSSDSSSSSDSESNHELDLNTVNECIREYEKGQKKERKKRWDAGVKPEKVILDAEDIASKIILSPAQIRKIQKAEQKERTEKQKIQLKEMREKVLRDKLEAKKVVDMRKDKTSKGVEIPVSTKVRTRKPKVVKEESESEEEEPEPPKKTRGFQAKKPQLDDEDDIEHTVAKLNKINSVLESGNPYLAMIMKNRMGHKWIIFNLDRLETWHTLIRLIDTPIRACLSLPLAQQRDA